MDVKNYYTYENFSLDPKTCVCVTDYQLSLLDHDEPDALSNIEQIMVSFFFECIKEHGPQQFYVARALDGAVKLGVAPLFVNGGAPDKLTFLNMKNPEKEEAVVKSTVLAFKTIINPLKVTGIFVEQEPGIWSIVHDGLTVGINKGILDAPKCPYCSEHESL